MVLALRHGSCLRRVRSREARRKITKVLVASCGGICHRGMSGARWAPSSAGESWRGLGRSDNASACTSSVSSGGGRGTGALGQPHSSAHLLANGGASNRRGRGLAYMRQGAVEAQWRPWT